MNKIFRGLPLAAGLLVAAGCSTPESRIRDQQALFDTWPAEVQQKIRVRHIDVGFLPDMVQMALGDADRAYSRTSEKGLPTSGCTSITARNFPSAWALAVSGGNTAYGSSVTLGDDVFRENEILRVIFEGGKVAAIETRQRNDALGGCRPRAAAAAVSLKSPKTAVGSSARNSSTEYRPVATAMVRAPMTLPHAISCGVSPITKTRSGANSTP